MKVFSIGYTAYSFEKFIEALKIHNVATLVDVRSHLYSDISPQYSKREFFRFLIAVMSNLFISLTMSPKK